MAPPQLWGLRRIVLNDVCRARVVLEELLGAPRCPRLCPVNDAGAVSEEVAVELVLRAVRVYGDMKAWRREKKSRLTPSCLLPAKAP